MNCKSCSKPVGREVRFPIIPDSDVSEFPNEAHHAHNPIGLTFAWRCSECGTQNTSDGKPMPELSCCGPMIKAHETGTDNEGYMPLVHSCADEAYPSIGDALPPINFCPWCGAKTMVVK